MFLLPRSLHDQMLRHARAALPREAAGFLFGRDSAAVRYQPMQNIAAVDHAFAMDSREVAAVLAAAGVTPLAVFHSHPTDLPVPSGADFEGAAGWRSSYHLILSLAGGDQVLRCWRLFDGQALPEPLHIVED